MSFVFCPDCGAPCSSSALQCPRCGFPVLYFGYWTSCPVCFTLCHNQDAKCPKCGNNIKGAVDGTGTLSIEYNPFDNPDFYAYDYANRWKSIRKRNDPENAIAVNPSLPVSLIEKLSQSPSDDVRLGIALNPSTPISVLMRLLHDSDEFVRLHAVQNPSMPPETLKELATTDDQHIRVYVASNHSITPEIIELLLADGDLDIFVALLENPTTPEAYRTRADQQISDYWRDARADHHTHNPDDPYEYDEPVDDKYLPVIGDDPESPLYGWHYDEDNGWLDYYPED